MLVAIAALVGLWLFRRELNRADLPQSAIDAGFAGIFGGLLGAKLWWWVEFFDTAPYLSFLLSRGGLSRHTRSRAACRPSITAWLAPCRTPDFETPQHAAAGCEEVETTVGCWRVLSRLPMPE